ncbi:uncharacterized protein LOC113233404 [Hyposmocoma kahamanoa]|uniref:uncharacterized protein LOC113233404 n=1 Tax=Hyposmocoma kahamanoa TaxID=1477025 RepID=UPI000E6D9146|nr:uncharacterized protein LOC113233404 [Hyposmocoma kahamanoa]
MFRVLTVVVAVLAFYDVRSDSSQIREKVEKSVRQKRLLFYDEEGNLVKTYKNPYYYDFTQTAEKLPFFSFFRPSTFGGPTAYMIPVSDQVIQQINNDPIYQNKLLTVPRKELIVAPNLECGGKRAQIPAKSCKNFLNCWDGWAFEQECPEGLLFSKEGYCDYPLNVDCNKRTNDSPSPPAPSQPTTPKCSKEFESFRNEQHCNEFFVCVDSTPVKFNCPADLLYNEELGVCDYAYRVNCKDSMTTTAEPAQPAPSNPETPCASPSTDGKKPAAPPLIATVIPAIPPVTADPPNIPLSAPISSNTIYNQQNWSSTHVAISRQDAIRQLRSGTIA